MVRHTNRVDRRTVLAATAGAIGMAGCSGGDDEPADDEDGSDDDEATTTDVGMGGDIGGNGGSNDVAGAGDGGASGGSGDVTECSMLPGSFTTFDPGAHPLPVTFEYPEAMSETMDFVAPDDPASTNGVSGFIRRGDPDNQFDGDIEMALGVGYLSNGRRDGREEWYEERSSLETLTTTTVNGESVDFLVGQVAGQEDLNSAVNVISLIPIRLEERDRTEYFRFITSIQVLLNSVDATDVSDACGRNLRDTIQQAVESVSINDATTFDQYAEL